MVDTVLSEGCRLYACDEIASPDPTLHISYNQWRQNSPEPISFNAPPGRGAERTITRFDASFAATARVLRVTGGGWGIGPGTGGPSCTSPRST